MGKGKVAIVHWSPVELYPPVMNMVGCLARDGAIDLQLHTTRAHGGRSAFSAPGCRVCRNPSPVGKGGMTRAVAYLWFQVATLWRLIRFRPGVVLYIEPSSAFPVYMYSLLRPSLPVFIHHHEYHSPDQFFRPGMRLIRWFHGLERSRLLRRARWVSHTNARRLELFCEDCPMVPEETRRVLPNYPSWAWIGAATKAVRPGEDDRLRLIYVGSASFETTFIRAAAEWVAERSDSVSLHVCGDNIRPDVRDWLKALGAENVTMDFGGYDYERLPHLLRSFDVGLVLYKGHSLNFVHNVPNKAIEYLGCGLEVWFPPEMESMRRFRDRHPELRLREVDFKEMPAKAPEVAASTIPEAFPFTCEGALAPLVAEIGEAVGQPGT